MITLNGDTIEVVYQSGDAKGNSFANPYTCNDIVAAALAGGWANEVSKNGTSYYINYKLRVYGYGTFFEQTNSSIVINSPTDHLSVWKMSANFKFDNCSFKLNNPIIPGEGGRGLFEGYYEITNCAFFRLSVFRWSGTKTGYSSTANSKVENVFIADGFQATRTNGRYQEWRKIMVTSNNYGVHIDVDFPDVFEDVMLIDSTLYPIFFESYIYDIYIKNLKVREAVPKGISVRVRYNEGRNIVMTDCEVDHTSIYAWGYTVPVGNTWHVDMFFKTTFSGFIANGSGSTLNVYDKDNNIVHSETLGSEDIQQKELTYYHLLATTEGLSGPTTVIPNKVIDDYEPFRAVVSKAGYDDLTIPDINVIAGQPTVIRGELMETAPNPPTVSSVQITRASSQTAQDGSITVEASSGTPPYEFSLNGSDWQSGGVFGNLAAGIYGVYVRDANSLADSISGIEVSYMPSTIFIDQTIASIFSDDDLINADFEMEEELVIISDITIN